MAGKQSWTEALQLHESAAAQFAQAAEAIPPELWSTPRAEGKWSPAQITEHLIRAYEVLLQELSGGAGMQIRTRWWQRLLLRFTLVPRLLAGGAFPVGARAPRETRPAAEPEAQPLLLARFRSHAASFQAAAEAARARNPRQRLTHAYFGAASVEEGVVLCARHLHHHQQQLSGMALPQANFR